MYELKSYEEIHEAMELLMQETDASKKTKSKHLLEYQFRLALKEIAKLEAANEELRNYLEGNPEYKQHQMLTSIASYFKSMT